MIKFLKDYKWEILKALAIVLMAVLAFGLGYLIRGEVKKSPIIIEKNSS